MSLNTSEYGQDPKELTTRSKEFILKVVGSEEYILYSAETLIVHYEAVRKAVRNEDDVVFQLDHRPDLGMIEQECFDRNIWYISSFRDKYWTAGILDDRYREQQQRATLKYCRNGYGDGKSLDEIVTAKMHNGFTKPFQQKQAQMMAQRQSQNVKNWEAQPPPHLRLHENAFSAPIVLPPNPSSPGPSPGPVQSLGDQHPSESPGPTANDTSASR